MMSDANQKLENLDNIHWKDLDWVAFDTETSGAYPLGSEIVEFAAVRWSKGQIVDEYQTLIRPTKPMSDFIIGIHGITNEMVADAPTLAEVAPRMREVFKNAIAVAHHAPFDLGFVTLAFEMNKISIPQEPAVCTSLLSRKVMPESTNHKLQTLVKFLNLPQGTAHRALDDAKACLQVLLKCFERLKTGTFAEIVSEQGKNLLWEQYRLLSSTDEKVKVIAEALQKAKDLDMVYKTGPNTRRVTPMGFVRNPDGDFLMATCHIDRAQKRFYLNKISDLQIAY